MKNRKRERIRRGRFADRKRDSIWDEIEPLRDEEEPPYRSKEYTEFIQKLCDLYREEERMSNMAEPYWQSLYGPY
jgi:hypothetical protein